MKTEAESPRVPAEDDLFTKREAADFLRLSPKTIERMIQRGQIRACMVASRWRIPRSSLLALTDGALGRTG